MDDICTFDGKPWRGTVDLVSGGFPAKRSVQQQEVEILQKKIYGEKCTGLSRGWAWSCLCRKCIRKGHIDKHRKICWDSSISANISNFQRKTLVQIMNGRFWLLAYTDYYSQLRSTKHAEAQELPKFCNRVWETFLLKTSKYLMGWPSGWTDLKPLEMDKFRLCG